MFRIIKRELEEKTSVRISPDYYAAYSVYSLAQGQLPELPYLWIIGCVPAGGFSEKHIRALTDFVDRGGIIFADLSGADGDSSCMQKSIQFH